MFSSIRIRVCFATAALMLGVFGCRHNAVSPTLSGTAAEPTEPQLSLATHSKRASTDSGRSRPEGDVAPVPLRAPSQTQTQTQTPGADSPTRPELPATASAWASLSIEGFEPALVSLPAHQQAAPLLVVTHGAGGNAQWHCQHWRVLTGARGFLLCLAGKRMIADRSIDSGYYYPDHHALHRELAAALIAFRNAYPQADLKAATFAGYSQGAAMGALVLAQLEPTFARAILVEGGFAEWNLVQAERFRQRGGQRILFVCGRQRCHDSAKRSALWLGKKGIEVETALAEGGGHTPAGKVAERTVEMLPWLWNGDARWSLEARVEPRQTQGGRR